MIAQDDTHGDLAKVSAIIPMYNAEAVIERAIKSALDQTCPCHEIIVVDDCSTDGSVRLIENLQCQYPQIKLIRQTHNQGPAAARSLAIDNASGDWIAVLDSDDRWRPERNAVMLELVKSTGADIAFDNLSNYDDAAGVETRPVFPKTFAAKTFDENEYWDNAVFGKFTFGILKCFVNRNFLNAHNLRYPDMRYAEDLLFYADIMHHGATAALTSDDLYIYTTRQGAVSKKVNTSSHSQPRFDRIATAISAFAEKNAATISAALRPKVEEARASHAAAHRLNEARAAKKAGDFARMLALLASPSVLKLMARMKWRARVVKRFSYDKLY